MGRQPSQSVQARNLPEEVDWQCALRCGCAEGPPLFGGGGGGRLRGGRSGTHFAAMLGGTRGEDVTGRTGTLRRLCVAADIGHSLSAAGHSGARVIMRLVDETPPAPAPRMLSRIEARGYNSLGPHEEMRHGRARLHVGI